MQRKPTKRYWRSFGALYGEGDQLEFGEKSGVMVTPESRLTVMPESGLMVTPKSKKPKSLVPTEQQEQFVAVAWLQRKGIPCHHSPNGGYRDYREAAKFKRLGTSAGFPDLFIPRARKSYHGLYIELKRVSGGRLSEAQIYWRDLLLAEGYAWFEAKGAEECIRIVQEYLDVK